jgi:hypothetical protein
MKIQNSPLSTIIDKSRIVKEEEWEQIIPSLIKSSGCIPSSPYNLYTLLTEDKYLGKEYTGRKQDKVLEGDTVKMFVEANFVPEPYGLHLFYVWIGFYKDCPEMSKSSFSGINAGAITRIVLTEKCLVKQNILPN